ncbi:PDZ domain-containing protein, partial [bacterium]|nr:PDZ domain-containing protein [bacterium]
MKCGFSWILVWCTLITAKISAQTDSLVWEAWQAVNDNYYDTAFHGTDWKKISAKYLTSGKNSRQTIQAMLSELRDPAIRLLTADQFNRFLTEVTGAEHEGIGLMELLSIDVDVKGNIVIVTPIPGTPAAEAGLQPLDKLTEINGQSVSNLQLQDVMDRLRVKKGQKLSLT